MTVRVAEVGRLFAQAGVLVITALISLLHVDRVRARAICGARFREVPVAAEWLADPRRIRRAS